jgi:hypothetical protein
VRASLREDAQALSVGQRCMHEVKHLRLVHELQHVVAGRVGRPLAVVQQGGLGPARVLLYERLCVTEHRLEAIRLCRALWPHPIPTLHLRELRALPHHLELIKIYLPYPLDGLVLRPRYGDAPTGSSEVPHDALLHALLRHQKAHPARIRYQYHSSIHELVHVVSCEDHGPVSGDILFAEHLHRREEDRQDRVEEGLRMRDEHR